MIALLMLFLRLLVLPSRPQHQLEAENAALKHQLAVLRRKQRGRVRLTNIDRLFFVQLYRWSPSILKALTHSTAGSTDWTHRGVRHGRRVASPICANLGFRHTHVAR